MKLEINVESKIAFLNQNLKSRVVGDFSRYINGTPKYTGETQQALTGVLNGINKNNSQQFDIDFDSLGGFEYYNCFNDICRQWSHTIHGEHLTVIKKPLSTISEIVLMELGYHVFDLKSRTVNIPAVVETSRKLVECMSDGNDRGFSFLTLLNAYQYLQSKGYVLPWMGLSVQEMIEACWIKLVEA